MTAIPLLHIGQTAARVSLDPWAVLPALLVLGVVLGAIWFRRSRPRSGARRRFVAGTTGAIVALALLPSVLPFDHLVAGATHEHGADNQAVHASHCHESPGTCSDAPVSSGPGGLISRDPLFAAPALLALLLIAVFPAMRGVSFRPPTPPPLVRLA